MFTALYLTNSPLLPGKATDYGLAMKETFKNFQQEHQQVLEQNGISIGKVLQIILYYNLISWLIALLFSITFVFT